MTRSSSQDQLSNAAIQQLKNGLVGAPDYNNGGSDDDFTRDDLLMRPKSNTIAMKSNMIPMPIQPKNGLLNSV